MADWVCGKAENRQIAERYASGEKKTGPTTTGTVSGSEFLSEHFWRR
jgi:hypothetical protein